MGFGNTVTWCQCCGSLIRTWDEICPTCGAKQSEWDQGQKASNQQPAKEKPLHKIGRQ